MSFGLLTKKRALTEGFTDRYVLHQRDEWYDQDTTAQVTDHVQKCNRGIVTCSISKRWHMYSGHTSRYVTCEKRKPEYKTIILYTWTYVACDTSFC